MQKTRIEKLITALCTDGLDAFLVSKPENIFYLTGLRASSCHLIISGKKLFVMTDFIYAEAIERNLKGFEIIIRNSKTGLWKDLFKTLKRLGILNLGIESSYISLNFFSKIGPLSKGMKLVPKPDYIERIREVKENSELSHIKKTIAITGNVFKMAKRGIGPNSTELDMVKSLKEKLIDLGADNFAFEPIVATQPNASMPHYTPRSRQLGHNRLILIDFGGVCKAYNSDLTRMLPLGRIGSKFRSLYNILLDAQRLAIDKIKPGAKMSDIDFAARQYIHKKGYGKFFGHALGHGIGLEVHELPVISKNASGYLKSGMVFTIEPGIYIPKTGGLRVEDIIAVKDKGCEVLTDDIDKSI